MFNGATFNSLNYNAARKRAAQFISHVTGRIITLSQTQSNITLEQNGTQASSGVSLGQQSNSVMLQ